MITTMQALLLGIWYYFIDLGMPNPQSAFYTVYRPLFTGAIVGLIMGDLQQGIIIGATINLVFIGFLSVGGAQSQDPALAGVLGTALAISSGMSPAMAVTLAIPLSVVGNFKTIFYMTFNSFFVRFSMKKIEKGDRRGLFIWNVLLPQLLMLIISVVPVMLACRFGAEAVGSAVSNMPGWISDMLTTIGALLPALGIAINLSVVAKGFTMPYFFLGFLLIEYLGLDIIVVAVVGCIIAALVIGRKVTEQNMSFDFSAFKRKEDNGLEREYRLTRRQVRKAWLRYIFQVHSCYQYEMLQGISFAESMGYVMDAFYKNDKERLIQEWKKHAQFYNTEPNFGSVIFGISVAMEEERANGEDVSPEAIQTVKTSLMGPIAGVGDTLIQGCIVPIFLGIFISMALNGSYFAPFAYVLIVGGLLFAIAMKMNDLGYNMGRKAVDMLLGNGLLNLVTSGMGVLGCMVLGALGAQFVTVMTPVELTLMKAASADETSVMFNLQADLLDVIFKGILPLFFILLAYRLIKKGWSSNKVLILLLIIGAVCGGLGILGVAA